MSDRHVVVGPVNFVFGSCSLLALKASLSVDTFCIPLKNCSREFPPAFACYEIAFESWIGRSFICTEMDEGTFDALLCIDLFRETRR